MFNFKLLKTYIPLLSRKISVLEYMFLLDGKIMPCMDKLEEEFFFHQVQLDLIRDSFWNTGSHSSTKGQQTKNLVM